MGSSKPSGMGRIWHKVNFEREFSFWTSSLTEAKEPNLLFTNLYSKNRWIHACSKSITLIGTRVADSISYDVNRYWKYIYIYIYIYIYKVSKQL